MSIEDTIKLYKDGKITKEEFERRIREVSKMPEDLKQKAALTSVEQVDFAEARELLKSLRERSEKMKKL